MRYIFGFEQQKLIDNGITLEQALLLKYMQFNNGKELTYSQLMLDLKILNIGQKQLSRLILDLVSNGFINQIKTRYGFIVETRQKCLVLNASVDKNVQSEPVQTRQKCPLPNFIKNNIYNINYYKSYTGCNYNNTSNILLLIEKWYEVTHKEIICLPNKGYDRLFDIEGLLSKMQKSRIAKGFPFKVIVDNYDKIMNDEFEDFYNKKEDNKPITCSRVYTKEELDNMFTNLDEVEI